MDDFKNRRSSEFKWPTRDYKATLNSGVEVIWYFAFGPYGLIGPSRDKSKVLSLLASDIKQAEKERIFTEQFWREWDEKYNGRPIWKLSGMEFGCTLWILEYPDGSKHYVVQDPRGGEEYRGADEAVAQAKFDTVVAIHRKPPEPPTPPYNRKPF